MKNYFTTIKEKGLEITDKAFDKICEVAESDPTIIISVMVSTAGLLGVWYRSQLDKIANNNYNNGFNAGMSCYHKVSNQVIEMHKKNLN